MKNSIAYILGAETFCEIVNRLVACQAELEEIKKVVDKYPYDRKYMEGRSITIKEFLGVEASC